ncbi:MAG: hypothetical protein M1833_007149 [Piccolia ochrophora]|nr:MAG: hypothetical protein M1833_007149 [Piccolia ochrophora]
MYSNKKTQVLVPGSLAPEGQTEDNLLTQSTPAILVEGTDAESALLIQVVPDAQKYGVNGPAVSILDKGIRFSRKIDGMSNYLPNTLKWSLGKCPITFTNADIENFAIELLSDKPLFGYTSEFDEAYLPGNYLADVYVQLVDPGDNFFIDDKQSKGERSMESYIYRSDKYLTSTTDEGLHPFTHLIRIRQEMQAEVDPTKPLSLRRSVYHHRVIDVTNPEKPLEVGTSTAPQPDAPDIFPSCGRRPPGVPRKPSRAGQPATRKRKRPKSGQLTAQDMATQDTAAQDMAAQDLAAQDLVAQDSAAQELVMLCTAKDMAVDESLYSR